MSFARALFTYQRLSKPDWLIVKRVYDQLEGKAIKILYIFHLIFLLNTNLILAASLKQILMTHFSTIFFFYTPNSTPSFTGIPNDFYVIDYLLRFIPSRLFKIMYQNFHEISEIIKQFTKLKTDEIQKTTK